MNQNRIRGLVAAPFTPFHADGSVDLAKIAPYANHLSNDGVAGVFVCGTTGEGYSLSIDERMSVAAAWAAALPKSMRLIVHVGHNSIKESRRLSAHAAASGAHAIAMMPPFFFKPSGVEEVVRCCKEVAAAAPELPFYFYHIPSMSGVHLPMAELVPAAAAAIPNFAGIKFTFEDIEDFQKCRGWAGEDYDLFFGRDEILLSALRVGATAAVGSTYNFAAPLYLELIRAFNEGDNTRAEALQAEAVRMIDTVVKGPWHPLAAFKWLMTKVGVDCGPTRLPVNPLTAEQITILESRLAGFIEERLKLTEPLKV
ncbi:MAG: dihydrodipicolinate synthase family protein [Opitutales bacterium]|nr:dihydrodipicolinate synthase family protein [Opitutales bacterium]